MTMSTITLSKAQDEAVTWFHALPRRMGILADEVGVGKSFPAVQAALERAGPRLLVVPAYLIPQWAEYLCVMGVPRGEIAAITGTQSARVKATRKAKQEARWVIISYQTLGLTRKGSDGIKRVANPWIFEVKWGTVIFDEAHRLRNKDSQQFKAAFRLRSPFTAIYFLTADPYYKNVGDVWPLLHIIDPQTFRGYWTFIEEHCYIEENPWTRKPGRLKDPQKFHEMMRLYMLRRTAKEVGLNLEEAREVPLLVDLDPKWVRPYRDFKRNWVAEHPDTGDVAVASGAGALIVGLRHITGVESQAKMQALKSLLEDLQGERVVVVCWYHDTVAAVAEVLKSERVAVTLPKETHLRKEAIELWERVPGTVLLGTEASMWEGLDGLQHHASTLIFYESDWTHAANHQMIGRLNRRGQERLVKAYFLVTKGTIDYTIYSAHKERRELSQQALISIELQQPQQGETND